MTLAPVLYYFGLVNVFFLILFIVNPIYFFLDTLKFNQYLYLSHFLGFFGPLMGEKTTVGRVGNRVIDVENGLDSNLNHRFEGERHRAWSRPLGYLRPFVKEF